MVDEKLIIQLYNDGQSCDKIAREVGFRSHVSVLNILKNRGVVRRNRHDCMLGTHNARKHTLNETFFRTIDTEAKAYQLGLLFADGWINEKSGTVGISLIDREVVERLKFDIGSSTPIVAISPKKKTHNIGYSLVFASKTMIGDLNKHGCSERKSLTVNFPTTVPKELLHHFIRGYWDGDGFVTVDRRGNLRFGMCGSEPFIKRVQEIFTSINLTGPKIEKHGAIFRLDFSGNIQALRFRQFLFRDATIWMGRKKEKLFSISPKYQIPTELRTKIPVIFDNLDAK